MARYSEASARGEGGRKPKIFVLDTNIILHDHKAIRKFIKSNYKNPIYKLEADIAQLNKTPSRDVMWDINGKTISNHMIVRTITCNMDRTHTAALFKYNGPKGDTYRRLTMREAFLLMGFTEKEYVKASSLNFSYRKLNKLIGNSIVVNVLQAIFEAMFGDTYMKKEAEED